MAKAKPEVKDQFTPLIKDIRRWLIGARVRVWHHPCYSDGPNGWVYEHVIMHAAKGVYYRNLGVSKTAKWSWRVVSGVDRGYTEPTENKLDLKIRLHDPEGPEGNWDHAAYSIALVIDPTKEEE